jgi:uncharacterized protein (DUF362 family)
MAGRTVVIKPNLVVRKTAETGATTDPQVVRALVDLALAAGAARVLIVESGGKGANFSACGYDFFRGYYSNRQVELVDLNDQPVALTRVPDGMAYQWIYMPRLLLEDDVVFVSAAKLKCHVDSLVSLAMKNLFGLPPIRPYQDSWIKGRFAMHKRGVHQTIVDLNLVRPVDFAVVDGVWGMESNGPLDGIPVRLDTVVAGRNAVAVDRVCLEAMSIPQGDVQHLEYAARKGLGPADVSEVEVYGDPLTSRAFLQPDVPPIVDYPRADPRVFVPGADQRTRITYRVDRPCWTRVEIVRTWEVGPWVRLIHTLHDWTRRPAGAETLTWDGRDDDGQVVPSGRYTVRVRATAGQKARVAYATSPVWLIAAHAAHLPESSLPGVPHDRG